jgi:betaine-aldehyde dehydrogenase
MTTAATQIAQPIAASGMHAATRATRIARHWINGQWRGSAQLRESINPATGEKIGSYAYGKEAEAADAVAAAVRAFRETDWRTNRELRSRVLIAMADRFEVL